MNFKVSIDLMTAVNSNLKVVHSNLTAVNSSLTAAASSGYSIWIHNNFVWFSWQCLKTYIYPLFFQLTKVFARFSIRTNDRLIELWGLGCDKQWEKWQQIVYHRHFGQVCGHVTFKMAASWKKIGRALKPNKLWKYLTDPGQAWLVMLMLFIAECFVNVLVIQKVKCKL